MFKSVTYHLPISIKFNIHPGKVLALIVKGCVITSLYPLRHMAIRKTLHKRSMFEIVNSIKAFLSRADVVKLNEIRIFKAFTLQLSV